jgi:hypothetical protein
MNTKIVLWCCLLLGALQKPMHAGANWAKLLYLTLPITGASFIAFANRIEAYYYQRAKLTELQKQQGNQDSEITKKINALKQKWNITRPVIVIDDALEKDGGTVLSVVLGEGTCTVLSVKDLNTCPDGAILHEERRHQQWCTTWRKPLIYASNLLITQGITALGKHMLENALSRTSLITKRLARGVIFASIFGLVSLCTRPLGRWLNRRCEYEAKCYTGKRLFEANDVKGLQQCKGYCIQKLLAELKERNGGFKVQLEKAEQKECLDKLQDNPLGTLSPEDLAKIRNISPKAPQLLGYIATVDSYLKRLPQQQ